MSYRLVIQEETPWDPTRAVGENVLFSNLSHDYKVFVFYYPRSAREASDDRLEELLRALGESTGNNLFVNIGGRADPEFDEISKHFRLERWPAIVLTASVSDRIVRYSTHISAQGS